MNLELTILICSITFIVMLIILANLYNKMRTIIVLLNVLVKKLNAMEEKTKWDHDLIKTKLEKVENKNDKEPKWIE
ncbi:MAG: hypothetical protein NZ839_04740 [Endomicrobia bacterium]|nr:hypothetical protein [Endomicrobiia bacterium]MCX7716176.1 hypothetical protein [Endomicrobiia bacterium]